ncbi:acetyltransferase [Penicillium lagena]|uniref:acetyltransferase n=1 Tax=Penicillium lagena TaxID=94218 RepID=UPI002540BDDD|nr:acetyltransferase [Penicillium lagena]KAJ5610961.1 acetyltransferase [Penicillium lagena]
MNLWFAAFSDPHSRRLFPNTPGVRKWLEDAIRDDLLRRPFQRYVQMVDPGSKDANGQPRIAAYAKLDWSTPEERGPRYPPWNDDMPKEDCQAFVDRGESSRKRVIVLDLVATHPDYQRRGAASRLVQWGCDLADVEGADMYVSASKDGASLYAKFGFVDYSNPGQETITMIRRARQLDVIFLPSRFDTLARYDRSARLNHAVSNVLQDSPSHPSPVSQLPKSATTALSSPATSQGDEALHPVDSSRVEKRRLNTLAARRCRQRRVDRMKTLEDELASVRRERDELKLRVSKLEGETDALRGLLSSQKR